MNSVVEKWIHSSNKDVRENCVLCCVCCTEGKTNLVCNLFIIGIPNVYILLYIQGIGKLYHACTVEGADTGGDSNSFIYVCPSGFLFLLFHPH